ncbi:MAG: beta strand repeat-containing protein, partial [Athalassotoga sp.]
TSQYEGFLVNGTPFATFVNVATAVKVLNASYPITVPVSALTSAGSTTFMFKDVSIGGNTVVASHTYVVVKATPVLRASYKGTIPSSGNTLYVGISPTTFQVYAYDPYWMTSAATLGQQPFVLTKNGTATVDVSGLTNKATEAFSAKVTNYANLSSSLNLTIVRVTTPPTIHYAYVNGLSTYNGVPYSTSGTITVVASVTSPYLSGVTLNLQTDNATPAMYALTKSSTGLWTGTVNTANLLPGTYKSQIIAQDLALNVATALTSPATVNVYRSVQNVFTTTLTTLPSTPINGYVKSATLTANINPTWVYAIKSVKLYRTFNNTTVASGTTTGNYASAYPFTITASGTYFIVTVDNANQRATGTSYTVNIDNSLPQLKLVPTTQTANASSVTITAEATDNYSGIANLTLSYQTLGATGADNGGWVTIGSKNFANTKTASYAFVWKNLNTLPNGKYNIQLVGTSGVGNTYTVTGYVINNVHGGPQVIWTPSATLVFTNKATYVANFTVQNESDITATMTYHFAKNTAASATSRFVSLSYTAYPLTEATTLRFTPQGSYTYKATVTNMAGKVATTSTVFVYDTTAPTATLTAATGTIKSYGKIVAAAGTPVTFTIQATDNLSGIKSVVVSGKSATLKQTGSVGQFGQILKVTYTVVLNAPTYTANATWTVTATVTDNAGNVTTKALQIWIDAAKPVISVSFYNPGSSGNKGYLTPLNGYVYSSASPTVVATVYGYELTVKATYYANNTLQGTPLNQKKISGTSTPSSYVSFTATYTNTLYKLSVLATDNLNKLSNSNTTSATVVIGSKQPTVQATLQTRSTTIPYMLNGKNMDHYINLASSNTTYNATIIVKDPNSIPIQSAAFYINGTPYPFISNGQFVTQPGLNVVSKTLVNGGITAATLTVNLNQTPYVSQTGLYALTVTATDFALNTGTTNAATSFYYDVTKPVLQPNKTLYKSGNYYYFDLGFSEQMATLTNKSVAASTVTFQLSNGLTYTSNPASQEFVPVTTYNTGLLHIWGLKTTSGATTNVLPLARNIVTITVGASYVSAGGNPVTGPVTVTFTNVSVPKPVNP